MTRRRAQYSLRNSAVSTLFAVLAAGNVAAAEPKPDLLSAVVGLESTVPAEARTAAALGTKRQGSGVVIDDAGLVLTIGYLILEAESVELSVAESRRISADVLAYDHETGLGLVRASRPLGVAPIPIGSSEPLVRGRQVLVASAGGVARGDRRLCRFPARFRRLVGIPAGTGDLHRAGAPAFRRRRADRRGREAGRHRFADGAGRGGGERAADRQHVRADRRAETDSRRSHRRGPRFPALAALARSLPAGDSRAPVRHPGSPGGPADRAGLKPGDLVLGVAGKAVSTLPGYYRTLWNLGPAGVEVPLSVLRGNLPTDIRIRSIDRQHWFRKPPSY